MTPINDIYIDAYILYRICNKCFCNYKNELNYLHSGNTIFVNLGGW